jgi:hypothetical protein
MEHAMNDRSTARRDDLARRFGFDSWPIEGDQAVRVSGFEFSDGDVPGYRPHRVVRPPTPPGVVAVHESVWVDAEKPASDDAVLLVDVYECESHEAAKETLLNLLGQVQSTEVERLEGIGDVAFSPGEGAVFFVRGNLAVRLLAGGPAAEPVRDRARGVDEGIRRRSQGQRPGTAR